MSRQLGFLAAIVAAMIIAQIASVIGAGSTISGTVKITGLASNADVVVYVQQAPGTFPPGKPADMDQRKMQFLPHVLPVVAGTTVKFLNSDPTPHNVFSPNNEKYNLGTWPQGQKKSFKFDTAGVVPLFCNVHPEMSAYVVVVPTPYFATSDLAGNYKMENVPDGSYTVTAWHEGTKSQSRPVKVSGEVKADFALSK
jgi:plastocyanin